MTLKKTLIISSIIFILLFALSIVSASMEVSTYTPSKDFLVTSASSELNICSCSTKYDVITITNTGTWPAIFTISSDKIKSFVTLSKNSFELNSGESTDVFLYINAVCTEGSENLDLTITSNLGTQKLVTKHIVRDKCQNIGMWIHTPDTKINKTGTKINNTQKVNNTQNLTNVSNPIQNILNINPCESKTFEIYVQNVGPFEEQYVMGSNYKDIVKYNVNSFILAPNQIAKINATVKFDCSVYGLKEVVFKASSVKNKLTATLNTKINILRNYDYDLRVNNNLNGTIDVSVCDRVYSTIIPISITNKGNSVNTYNIDFDNLPKNVKVEGLTEDKITIEPGATGTFYMNVDASKYRNEEKTKTFEIQVASESGDIEKNAVINLDFTSCYEHTITVYDGKTSKFDPIKVCQDKTYSYDVEITNDGIYEEKYTLSIDGAPSSVRLSKNSLTLKPGTKDSVKLLIRGPAYNYYYNIKVNAAIANHITESDNIWIKSYDAQSCHATTIGKTNFKINYQTNEIIIPITNKGITEDKYLVLWQGTDIVELNTEIINLDKSESGKIVLETHTRNVEEGIYNGTLSILDTGDTNTNTNITITLKDKNIVRKGFEYFAFGNICRQFSFGEILAILIIIAIIIIILMVGPNYQYNFKNRLKTKIPAMIFLIVLLLIGIILVVTITGLPKTNTGIYNLTVNDSELRYEWLQDDKYVLDVSKFFYDPENTTLKYEVSGLEHIKVVSTDDSITFYPDLGWSGTEYAKITAFDKMGGNITSPRFTLTVLDVPKKSYLELYTIYCWYVNVAIFAIILFLVFVAIFVKQKKRGRK